MLNCAGKLLDLSTPRVMGIINATPDSFFSDSRKLEVSAAIESAAEMIDQGADILDIGGQSTRPGAQEVGVVEEIKRVVPLIREIKSQFPNIVISVDTYHARVAEQAAHAGAAIVNDISGGTFDDHMLSTVADLGVPYVLMHTSGRPDTMQDDPRYRHVTMDVAKFFSAQIRKLHELGVKDIILDPGFGFGKTLEHNYQLFNQLEMLQVLRKPVLIGVSRKSMINNILITSPIDALNGTTALHAMSLPKGVDILRVHDVREAREVVKLFSFAETQNPG